MTPSAAALPARRLEGRVAIVTGAARGIGCAIAGRFAREGCRLLLCDEQAVPLHATASTLSLQGAEVASLRCDVSNPSAAPALVEAARQHFGALDILVNNAAICAMGGLESATQAEFESVMAVDVRAILALIQAALGLLKKSGRGRIINLGSVEGIAASAPLLLYSAAKHAVVGLTRAAALELGRHGITVNVLCPGPVDTQMLAPAVSSAEARAALLRHIPARRLGTPEDVAGAALFLASDDGGYVNGHVLVIDGGLTADICGTPL